MAIAYNASVVRDGLVLYLDAANQKSYTGTGTTCYDLTNNTSPGFLGNGTAYVTSATGAFSFDNSNDYITVPHSSAQLTPLGGTAECWIYPKSAGVNGNTRLIMKCDDNIGLNGFNITLVSNNVRVRINAGVLDTTTNPIVFNTWSNLSVTWTASTCSVYINGLLIISGNAGTTVGTSTATIWVGQVNDGNFNRTFDGYIASAKLYNRVLNQNEILQNFNATRGRYGI